MRAAIGAVGLGLLLVGCVPQGGGGGGDDPARDGAVEVDDGVCTPACDGRACGPDGCGGVCGACDEAQVCTAAGACLDIPASCGDGACTVADGETCETCPADCGACCGDGACTPNHGEHCGTCPADCGCPEGETCDAAAGVCAAGCTPACDGRECGDDGCGGACGACEAGEVCGADGACAAPPDSCGDGACGEGEDCANCAGDCGCGPDRICRAGQCVAAAACGDGACDPGEDCGSCAADCGCAAGSQCRGGECVCVPSCGDAVCGDDGCGGACGACPPGAACAGGACVFECPDDCGAPWVGACTDDGFGLRLCVPDPERPGCTTPSRRIPCGEGRLCNDGAACEGDCVKPEVILLVDRSSSMIGERWQFTRQTLTDVAGARGTTARLGLRTFPGQGDGCGAGPIAAPVFDALRTFQQMPEPAPVAQTPISAAFDGVEAVFGDPDEGESVVLITDGDETCEDELAAVARVEALRRRGIRTFAVGITRQANGELLAAIAAAGGTTRPGPTPYYVVEDAAELQAALGDIFTRLETCACAEGEARCAGETRQICAPDGFDYADERACPFGCNPDDGLCFAACDPRDAAPGCDGDTRLQCSAAGEIEPVEQCAFGCREGAGCNALCRPGERVCEGESSLVCTEDGGAFAPVEVCDRCDPATGLCGVAICAPLVDARCGPGGREVCREDGTGFDPAERCDCNPETALCLGELVEGALRLVGVGPRIGRLEIYHAGQWGTVCDDNFAAPDEIVACRQLGYPGRVRQFDSAGAGPIWMDEVACDGDEVRLDTCGFAGWGRHNCQHNEDVALECEVPRVPSSRCMDPATSWSWRENGVVRRQLCREGCDPATGLCVGQAPGAALAPDHCYAHHGDCGSWNSCLNAEGCADRACAHFGWGPALSWVEAAECDAGANTCDAFRLGGGLDEDWQSRVDCDLPGACQVVCSSPR